jgi:hypothetical protein
MRYQREMEALLEKAKRATLDLYTFRIYSASSCPFHPLAIPSPTRS